MRSAPRPPVRCGAATGCESRPQEVADMAKPERVAFLGLGIMGAPMAANLARAGFELTVWNRTRPRAAEFVPEHEATVAESPAEAAAQADVTITMVPDGPEVEEVLF